jgi:hypothetical protein
MSFDAISIRAESFLHLKVMQLIKKAENSLKFAVTHSGDGFLFVSLSWPEPVA